MGAGASRNEGDWLLSLAPGTGDHEPQPIPAPTPLSSRQKTLSRTLLKKRDRVIGVRINATLQAVETGLLFLGRLHSLEPWLAKDISVTYPIYQPLGGQPTEGSGANS